MRFLIIGDLHGQKPVIHFTQFDAIIAPGDFCSDALRTVMFQALRKNLKNPNTNVRWWKLLGEEKARMMVRQSLTDGRTILEYLNRFGVPVYVLPGNWDWHPENDYVGWSYLKQDYWQQLIKGLANIHDMHLRFFDIGDYLLIGHGVTSGPEYPQHPEEIAKFTKAQLLKKKQAYQKRFAKMNSLFTKATKPVIFLTHNVPFNTPIDEITDKNSPRVGYHFGSLLARELIEKHQPLVCIGGHMHEHFTSCRIGKTTAINAGFGSFVNVLLELQSNTIQKLEFHQKKS
ncbi:MAG: metallophosphoesterase [Nanoarchaeota archaeon]